MIIFLKSFLSAVQIGHSVWAEDLGLCNYFGVDGYWEYPII